MSENSGPIFNDFHEYVNRMKAELASVDANYCADDSKSESAKNLEKLDIYSRYTDDLICNSYQYLDVIDHLRKELARNNSDTLSIGSSSTISEGTVEDDMNFVRQCLENRLGMEQKAFDSLMQGKTHSQNPHNFIAFITINHSI